MRIYDLLSRIAFIRKRLGLKILFIIIPGIFFPVAGLYTYIMLGNGGAMPSFVKLLALLVFFTAISAVVMQYMVSRLIRPLHLGKQALNNYIANREIPQLPIHYEDEAGVLLSDIQSAIIKLDSLIQEKSDMIDLLSHDLRSPVGRVLSLSELIKADTEGQKDLYADYIANECKGLLRVLENILLMLKEDTHAFRLVSVNLKDLIEETVAFFDFTASEKNLNIAVSIDESLHVLVQQDLFTQAVRNIIGNAIKFSSDGKSIYIYARQDKDQIYLSIQDEGLGFVSEDIQRIFDRFTQAGKKGTRGEGSVGLGLYLSKKIVERHGGKLLAESEGLNKGATFTIVLYRLIIKKRQVQPVPTDKRHAQITEAMHEKFATRKPQAKSLKP
jgi:signal transduction histidine kinase